MMSLKEYNKKRNFKSTNEPKGKIENTKTNRFVIQYHQARAKHYDFRLEYNGVLLSWAVPKGLSENPKQKRLAVMVEDHPLDYINFEGIIPKGNYGAGSVEIFDSGNYLQIEDFEKGLKKGLLKFVLNGKKLKGGWSLIKTNADNWLIVKTQDEFSTQKVKKIKNPFSSCRVQLATLSNQIPKGKDWIFEIKYDGYRVISYVENGKVKMFSRNNQDYTKKFNSIAKSLKNIQQNAFIIDGEVVVFDENGKSDFGLLQNAIKSKHNKFFYVIFDLLALNGEDLRDYPLISRKEKLERMLVKSNNNLLYSNHVISKGEESFLLAKEKQLEGIIAKNSNSTYSGSRSEDWLKIKCYQRQEFVIGGFTTSSKNEFLSALLLGYFKNKKFFYVGKVGTGFSEQQKKELHAKFKKQIRKTCPFDEISNKETAIWLTPHFVAEIQFAELTKENLLRQPSFIALRQDKDAKDVKLEVAHNE